MNIITRNTTREYLRNGKLNFQGGGGTVSYSTSYGGGGGIISGNYLPAIKNSDGTYTVDLTQVTFNGNVIAQGEVSAYQLGSGTSSTSGSVTVYDGLDSSDSAIALSANQGRILNEKITNLTSDISGASTSLSALTDTNISTLTNGQILVYDGTSAKWINKTFDFKSSAATQHISDTTVHITATERTNWNNAFASAHTHTNKTVLDGITTDLLNKWNSAYTHISDSVTHVTESEKTNWNNKLDKSIWDSVFYFDTSNNLRVKLNLIGEKEVSAYGSGATSSSSNGAITIVDNLTSTLTDAALSANQGRVLKNLIDTIDIGDLDLSEYSKTSHTHSNYSLTSHTHSQYASSSHTHPISAITSLQTTLDGKSSTSHTHSNYSLTSHTHTFASLTSKPTTLSGYGITDAASSSHSHSNYSLTSHTHNYASTVKVGSTSYSVSANTITLPSYPTLSTLSGVSTSTFNTHSGNTTLHITATERTNWNKAYTNNHTHSNKSVLDGITSTKVSNWDEVYNNWVDVFEIDSNGNLKVKVNVIGQGEISAYGSGATSSSSSGAITIVDNLTSTLTDAALSANQGRVLKNLIDTIDVSGLDLSEYSKTSHTHSNYSLTSHTHSQYASSSHTHPISAITSLQSTLDGKSSTSHTHSNYSTTSHTHSNYSLTSHTHNYAAASHTHSYASTVKVGSTSYSVSANTITLPSYPTLSSLGAASSSHTHSNYSLTSHTHSNYSVTSHTHSYLPLTGGTVNGTLAIKRSASVIRYYNADGTSYGWLGFNAVNTPVYYNANGDTSYKLLTENNFTTFTSVYYSSDVTRTANTVLAAPNGSNGTASFRSLVAADIPSLAISKITNLQSSLNAKSGTGHTHSYAGSSSAGGAATSANKVNSTLTFTTGATTTGSFNGSAAVTIKIPSNTTHLTNGSGFITTAATVTNADKLDGYHRK